MTVQAITPWLKNAHEEFSARCAQLNLPTWACDARGTVVAQPRVLLDPCRWWESPVLQKMMTDAAEACMNGQVPKSPGAEPTATEIFTGCSLLIFYHQQGGRTVGASMVLTMTGAALQSDEFKLIATAAEMDDISDIAAMQPFCCESNHHIAELSKLLQWTFTDTCRLERDKKTLVQFGEKLVQAYEETNMLFRFARSLNCTHDPQQLMGLICHQLQQTLPLRWVAMRFVDHHTSRVVPDLCGKMIVMGDLPCDEQQLDDQIVTLLDRWGTHDWTRLLEPKKSPLAQLVGAEVIAEQITHDDVVIGMLLAGNRIGEEDELSSAEMQFIDAAADFLGVFHENLARFSEQRSLFLGTLQALTSSIDAKDAYTCGHSERVALLAKEVAQAMKMDRKTVEQFHVAGLVHDVGKIGVPEAVLCKPGRLSDAEFEHIRRHPRIGFEILKDIPMFEPMLPGVLHHHERWDGSGYPAGFKGKDIPLMGRVLAVADAFDAMSSNRSYRPAMPRHRVFAEIRRCSGTQFDPEIAAIFLTLNFAAFDSLLMRHHGQSQIAA